jgi:ribosomal protein L1
MAGKKYKKATTGWDPTKKYSVDEACAILPKTKISTKWDETVDVAVRLGVNPKYADQMVRGSVVMPSGTGKTKRVLVICKTDKVKRCARGWRRLRRQRRVHQQDQGRELVRVRHAGRHPRHDGVGR